jgi:hypothetical protein
MEAEPSSEQAESPAEASATEMTTGERRDVTTAFIVPPMTKSEPWWDRGFAPDYSRGVTTDFSNDRSTDRSRKFQTVITT